MLKAIGTIESSGTFTPTIIGTGTAGTATYSSQIGKWCKVGSIVFIEIFLYWSSGTGTGNLRISGLPFTAANNGTNPGLSIGDIENVATTADYVPLASVMSNSTEVQIREVNSGLGISNPAAYDAAGQIRIAGCYSI